MIMGVDGNGEEGRMEEGGSGWRKEGRDGEEEGPGWSRHDEIFSIFFDVTQDGWNLLYILAVYDILEYH